MAEKRRKTNNTSVPNAMMLRRTLILMIVCGIVAFAVVGLRLFKLQIIDHDKYESAAIEQQVRDTTITAARGTIYDTNMKILAMSASVYDVYISPREIEIYGEDPQLIARGLSEILGVDYDTILEKTKNTKSWYQTIAYKVEPDISDQVRKFKNENGDGGLKGVHLEESSKRYYPYNSLAAQTIGFVGRDNSGLSGIESRYNSVLTGVNGRVVRAKNAAGTDMLFTSFEDYVDAQDGNSTVITLDSTIQHYVEKHLEQAVRDYGVSNGAATIVMEVDTGAILAMASLGSFDLNNYQSLSEEAQKIVDETLDDPATANVDEKAAKLSELQNLQWRNKALSDTYEPGSTFKILTLSMALNEGTAKLSDSYYCGGSIQVAGDTKARSCWKLEGHGSQTLTQALQHSCNVAFINMGLNVGAEKFYDYCEAFGLFEGSDNPEKPLSGSTGIDLGGESGSIWWSRKVFEDPLNKSQLAAASFGQTFNITPLQLITAVSACVNGGNLMQPYVVKEVLNSEGKSISKTEPVVVRQVISEETSKTVCSMLEQVVGDKVEGTGKNAAVPGYRIGGKTGTSTNTTIESTTGEKKYIVSFIGVAPIDDPKIAILTLLDCPDSTTAFVSGGRMAAPVVGEMMADILPYLGFEPDYSNEETKIIDRAVPNIVNLTREEAVKKLEAAGFTTRIIGDGAAATGQLPAANSIIAADSQVIIYCDAQPSPTQELMPDLSNLTYSIARQRMGAYGLFIRASGPITNPTTVLVMKQSVAAGTPIDHGTVVEVTVADTSMQGRY